jgi:hypothetical protein
MTARARKVAAGAYAKAVGRDRGAEAEKQLLAAVNQEKEAQILRQAETIRQKSMDAIRRQEAQLHLLSEPEYTPEPDPADPVFQPHFAMSLGLDTGVELLLGADPSVDDLRAVRAARQAADRRQGAPSEVASIRIERAAESLGAFLRATAVPSVPALARAHIITPQLPSRTSSKLLSFAAARSISGQSSNGGLNTRQHSTAAAAMNEKQKLLRKYRKATKTARAALRQTKRRSKRHANASSKQTAQETVPTPSSGAAARLSASLRRAVPPVPLRPLERPPATRISGLAKPTVVLVPDPSVARIRLPSIDPRPEPEKPSRTVRFA